MAERKTIQHPDEDASNSVRHRIAETEPASLRTFTPSQAVLSRSAGCFHWTPEGRRLYDFTSGVLVANLGHNPNSWMRRFGHWMGWTPELFDTNVATDGYAVAVSMTAYNAITEVEAEASARLLANMRAEPGGGRMETVAWAASGSEAVQKALWACLDRDPKRDIILATRHGFHGKKGLAGAVTGSEHDSARDPRVRFISFPRDECDDESKYDEAFDPSAYVAELEAIKSELGDRLCCLITEPYLGGGGSYHPPAGYLQTLQAFCRENGMLFVLDEVQSNFGRTGSMYAYTSYGIEPDIVCLGKGLGNGVPVSAAVGRRDVFGPMKYGSTSDTWSANPLSSAAVLATLDEFEKNDGAVLKHGQRVSATFMQGLAALKQNPVIAKVRGEGMVFGVECAELASMSSHEVANRIVEACYLGESGGDGIHLLGPLAGNVLRVSPPLTITESEAADSLSLFNRICAEVGSGGE